MKTKLLFSFWFFLVFSILSAQDTTLVQQDTFPETIQVDTLGQDSSLSISLGVPVSQDALEAAVD
ncbi:MAG: hypothetical protein ACRBG0_27935, partial [Lewinella sp.]